MQIGLKCGAVLMHIYFDGLFGHRPINTLIISLCQTNKPVCKHIRRTQCTAFAFGCRVDDRIMQACAGRHLIIISVALKTVGMN